MNTSHLRSVTGFKQTKPRTFTAPEEVMDLLRQKIYESQIRYQDIARECGLSESTLYAIRSGRTRWPRPKTLFALIKSFDLELILKEKEKQ